jgi:hypothetical protein
MRNEIKTKKSYLRMSAFTSWGKKCKNVKGVPNVPPGYL